MIWLDTHIHVSDFSSDGSKREHMLDDLLELLDRCDADLRFVISCDGHYNSLVKQQPDGMMIANTMIHELCREAPDRLFGSCIVNPNYLAESLRMMDVAFGEWGFVQLGEILQYMLDFQMDTDAGEQVTRRAVHYDVPVQIHLGTYWGPHAGASVDGVGQMEDLLGLAERVPEAKYILAHAIGCAETKRYIPWANWFLDVIAGRFDEYPDNFWIEIRDFHCPALPRAIAEVPSMRLLSGTDWTTRIGPPFQTYGTMFNVAEEDNPFPPKVESFIGFLKAAGASDEAIANIGHQNAIELYRLSI
ncbi:MAG: amidohydrolase family protein [Armatimonadetes bacterium]|nr:amidohydrolase family protein [Armatimonadota bacterium]